MFLVAAYDGVSVVLGVTRPFSLVPLVLLILGCIGAIALLSLLVPCEPLEAPKVDITFPSPALLLLVLLILLGILGPLVTNATGNTVVSLTAILVIVLVVALASIHDTVFSQLYPATIFAITWSNGQMVGSNIQCQQVLLTREFGSHRREATSTVY